MEEYDESSMEIMPELVEDVNGLGEAPRLESQVQALDSYSEGSMGTFTTGVDIFSKEERLKMEERAKRFGLTEKSKESLSNQEEDLYSSMGIMDDTENTKQVRLNVIHMRGTKDMSTQDVLKYFQDYAPQSIEWINDVSCNVVWFDNLSAARAMLGLSKKIMINIAKYSDRENNDLENKKDSEMVNVENKSADTEDEKMDDCKEIDCPLPPGIWRKGVDHPNSKGIFLRFATRMDKKPANAEKKSEYYKKYGNPNFGGIKGILTESRKRKYKQTQQSKRKPMVETKERDQKNPWGALSETWGKNDIVEDDFLPKNGIRDVARDGVKEAQGRSIKERLGIKCIDKDAVREAEESEETSSSSDSDEDWCKRSKIPRMRMHADDEEEKVQKRRAKLRHQMVLSTLNNSGDLRSKLGKSRTKTQFRDPIQIVVTNSTKPKRDNLEIQSSEREEGEWQESEEEEDNQNEIEEGREEQSGHVVLEEEEDEKEEGEEEEEESEHKDEEDSEEDSDVPAREIQGPKGSVIKVVPPKPRLASTVWARLNNVKSEISDSYLKNRQSGNRDLRNTLKGGDLRSRIGNHARGRSPLRIEVKNDKYTKNDSDVE